MVDHVIPFTRIVKVLFLSSAASPKAFFTHPLFFSCYPFASISLNVTITSLLGSLRAVIAPFLSDTPLTAWTTSCGDLLVNDGSVDPLTNISLPSRPGITFFGGSSAVTAAYDRVVGTAWPRPPFFKS
jgi:hypothetical protein